MHPIFKGMPLPNVCPLVCYSQWIGLGSLEKGAMVNWWCLPQARVKGKGLCVPHACLTCSHLSESCFQHHDKNTWLQLSYANAKVFWYQEGKRKWEKTCFQERVLSLSPQILPPFSSSASQTAVCMCLKGSLWGFWDSINVAIEVYTGAYKERTRGNQCGRMPSEEELNLGGLLHAWTSPAHSPSDNGSFIAHS